MRENMILKPKMRTLVVGLGGTGKKVLVQLKRRLIENGYLNTAQQPDLRLICLDFDPAEECTLTRRDGRGEVGLEPDEICWLDGNLIQNRLHNLSQPHNKAYYQDWYPDLDGAIIQMGSYRAGAAQWRPLGRMGYFEHAERIQMMLRRSMNRLLEVRLDRPSEEDAQGVAVYLACSLAGGTGGGMFLDVAYFLRTLPVNLNQVGLFLLPGIYAEYDISNRLNANSYASLKELSAFFNQTRDFNAQYPNGRRINVARGEQGPFDQVFLYDNVLLPDQVTTNPQRMAEIMAETIYFDLVAAKVGEMHRSAATNAGASSGVSHQGQELSDEGARLLEEQSVLGTVGSLTLVLPSRAELTDSLALVFLRKTLMTGLVRLEKTPNIWSLLPEAAGVSLENYPIFEEKLQKTMAGLTDKCLRWPNNYRQDAGDSLGNQLKEVIHNKDGLLTYVRSWLDELVAPRADGGFSRVPLHLPDTSPDPVGPLRQAREEIETYFNKAVAAQVKGAAGEEENSLEEALRITTYLGLKSQQLRARAGGGQKRLREIIDNPEGRIGRLIKELGNLSEAEPEETLVEDAARHWGRRFMRAVKDVYEAEACQIRLDILMANALDRVREEGLVSDAVVDVVKRSVGRVASRADEARARREKQREQGNTLVERSLADELFWERMWQAAGEEQSSEEAVLGFLLQVSDRHREAGGEEALTQSQVAEMAFDYSRKWAEETLEHDREFILDMHGFVDPRLRKEELQRARHDSFLTNNHAQRSLYQVAYATSPCYSDKSDKATQGEYYAALSGDLGNILSANLIEVDTYEAGRALGDDEPGKIYVRHLSLNHPAANLQAIGEYYYAYERYGRQRQLFHLDRRFVDFAEVIDASQHIPVVTCGNPGCEEDISDLPREVIICPHCGLPIRSRCGNPDCPENFLHLKPEMQGGDPDKNCPVCGGKARTYWWRCNLHNVDHRTDYKYCELCREELEQGKMDLAEVEHLEGVKRTITCPGCEHDCLGEPFQIGFLDVYDEVADSKVMAAWDIYQQQTSRGMCPKCGAQLLPFCPYPEGEERPHFVKRFQKEKDCQADDSGGQGAAILDKAHFICTSDQEHLDKKIPECSYCHLPLREEATYCPRCKRIREKDEDWESNPEFAAALTELDEDVASCREKYENGQKPVSPGTKLYAKLDKGRWLWFGLDPAELKRLSAEHRPGPDDRAGKSARSYVKGRREEVTDA